MTFETDLERIILIKGAGELASAIAHKLYAPCFKLCLTDLPEPLSVRRAVAFSEAVYEGEKEVEGVTARLLASYADIKGVWDQNKIAVIVDPSARVREYLKPHIVIDAIMAKKNAGTRISDAPLVIGVGPGLRAGVDCHMVVETNRGHFLGRILYKGEAEPNTGLPAPVMGVTENRVLRGPANGILNTRMDIGAHLKKGDLVGTVNGAEVRAETSGVLRGLLRNGARVWPGMKIGDIDPRDCDEHCFTISDKARAVAGGVLEAVVKYGLCAKQV